MWREIFLMACQAIGNCSTRELGERDFKLIAQIMINITYRSNTFQQLFRVQNVLAIPMILKLHLTIFPRLPCQ